MLTPVSNSFMATGWDTSAMAFKRSGPQYCFW